MPGAIKWTLAIALISVSILAIVTASGLVWAMVTSSDDSFEEDRNWSGGDATVPAWHYDVNEGQECPPGQVWHFADRACKTVAAE